MMVWSEVSCMQLRVEFVKLAVAGETSMAALCRRFGISRKTGYKWLARVAAGEGVEDRSRRPHASPRRTPTVSEAAVLALRAEHPSWGGRKIARRLADLGYEGGPAASTISGILSRHGLIAAGEADEHRPFIRFEHAAPNELWQMDFKGHFAHGAGRCHPLTVLDDHSRFSICLAACANQQTQTVRQQLSARFALYGLPQAINVDNGSPWGNGPGCRFTPLTVWLIRLGIRVSHSRPYHPQTNGKDERFHRTLKADLLKDRWFQDIEHCQKAFDAWRHIYNTERPHQAIGMATPASRYSPSARLLPKTLPEPHYQPDDLIRNVQKGGIVHFKGYTIAVPKALAGQTIALRPSQIDGIIDLFFLNHFVTQIDSRNPKAHP